MADKFSNIKERILYLSETIEDTKQKFFKKIGMSYSNFTGKNKERPINSDAIRNILVAYPQTNLYWLITGEGEMLRELQQNISGTQKGSNINSNINGVRGNIAISHNDLSSMIEFQKEFIERFKIVQNQLSGSQEQVTILLHILQDKTK